MSEQTYVALLRGVNVGGKNRLPMKELVEIVAAAGGQAPRTYIQSGNVVFRAAPSLAARLPAKIAAGIASRLDLHVPVVLRDADELAAVARQNPFLRAGADPQSLHVVLLADRPAAAAAAALDPRRSPPDAFVVRGREIYLCCPDGLGRSKLTNAWFDGALKTVSTMRNWKTILELVKMAAE